MSTLEMPSPEQIAGFSLDDINGVIHSQMFDENTIVPLMSRYGKLKFDNEVIEGETENSVAQQNPQIHQNMLREYQEMQSSHSNVSGSFIPRRN